MKKDNSVNSDEYTFQDFASSATAQPGKIVILGLSVESEEDSAAVQITPGPVTVTPELYVLDVAVGSVTATVGTAAVSPASGDSEETISDCTAVAFGATQELSVLGADSEEEAGLIQISLTAPMRIRAGVVKPYAISGVINNTPQLPGHNPYLPTRHVNNRTAAPGKRYY